mmetsp:Transcript_30003/g.81959  ORF Transcript_30003/g.81959 Transcript_30003/m.81959 type:complete len:204 (-) Transcript_30003:1148-1759(-)|eukprot:scaffold47986_cov28-Tisochrysis_lutea.AAC.1
MSGVANTLRPRQSLWLGQGRHRRERGQCCPRNFMKRHLVRLRRGRRPALLQRAATSSRGWRLPVVKLRPRTTKAVALGCKRRRVQDSLSLGSIRAKGNCSKTSWPCWNATARFGLSRGVGNVSNGMDIILDGLDPSGDRLELRTLFGFKHPLATMQKFNLMLDCGGKFLGLCIQVLSPRGVANLEHIGSALPPARPLETTAER